MDNTPTNYYSPASIVPPPASPATPPPQTARLATMSAEYHITIIIINVFSPAQIATTENSVTILAWDASKGVRFVLEEPITPAPSAEHITVQCIISSTAQLTALLVAPQVNTK